MEHFSFLKKDLISFIVSFEMLFILNQSGILNFILSSLIVELSTELLSLESSLSSSSFESLDLFKSKFLFCLIFCKDSLISLFNF